MKVLVVLIVAVSSTFALGSGPYLPSGWRPEGPAFFLPGEVKAEPSENPLKDTLFQESEASGSDFLREYGPPKVQEISQDLTQQGLPDVVTEQAFASVQARFNQEVVSENIKGNIEAVTEKIVSTAAQETTITEQISIVSEELETSTEDVTEENLKTEQPKEELQGRAIKLEVEASVAETTNEFVEASVVTESVTQQQYIVSVEELSTEANLEQNAKIEQDTEVKTVVEKITEQNENVQQNIVKSVVETIEENVEQSVKILEEEVKNIVQEIDKIENEDVQEQNVDVSGVKSIQVSGSLEQVPEGFLEYGPPGFREYGPPKGDDLLRSSAVPERSESEQIEKNEARRRRRFSPKFRPTEKH